MSQQTTPSVFLIGGAPGAGKTTLGTALANRLRLRTLSVDDLVTAVQAVTTPEILPGLHLMWQRSHLDYFTHTPVEKLKQDVIRQHEVAWPFIERVIRKHATLGSGIVIDGWHLWPRRVTRLKLDNVWAGWIVTEPGVLEAREKRNVSWLHGSDNPQQMLGNFLARSLWFNRLMAEQTAELGLNVLPQPGDTSVAQLCAMVLAQING